MSLKGMSDAGPTTAAADAPLANDKETPTTPSAGTTSFRRFRGEAASSLAYWSPPSHVAGLQSRLRAGAWQGEAAGRKRGLLRKAVRVRRVARVFHVGVASSRRFVYVRWQLRHPVSRWFARRKAPLWQEMRSAWSTHSDRGQPGSQTQRPRRS